MVPRIEITQAPLRAAETDGTSGAVVEFHGVVRGVEEGRAIGGIDYECHVEMASRQLERIAEETAAKFGLSDLVVRHRVGRIAVGEPSLYVRAEAPHRREAFVAVMELIERLKKDVPIWKHPYV
jgi:molybdopterin synthase catalytic subunit